MRLLDECDKASFDADASPTSARRSAGSVTVRPVHAPTCQRGGNGNWWINNRNETINAGDSLHVINQGGILHTFTEVKTFGSGVIPPFNVAVNNAPAAVKPDGTPSASPTSATAASRRARTQGRRPRQGRAPVPVHLPPVDAHGRDGALTGLRRRRHPLPGAAAPGSQAEIRTTTCWSVTSCTRTTKPPTSVCPPTGTITVWPATSICAMSASTRTSRAITPSTDTSAEPDRGERDRAAVRAARRVPSPAAAGEGAPREDQGEDGDGGAAAQAREQGVHPADGKGRAAVQPVTVTARRPGYGHEFWVQPLRPERLLLHHRRGLPRAGAPLVAVPQRVADLVVDDVLAVAGDVVGVLVGRVDPAVEGQHGARAVAARERAVACAGRRTAARWCPGWRGRR